MASKIFDVDFILFEVFESVQKILPNLLALGRCEVLIVEGELDAGFKGFIKGTDAVAC